MRTVLAAFVTMLAVAPVMAEFQTVLDEEDVWKLYTKAELKLSDVAGDTAELGGIQVGGILNDQIVVGLGAYALINDVNSPDEAYLTLESMDLWYAGLIGEYIFTPAALIHFSAGALLGYGNVEPGLVSGGGRSETDFFVLEPTANAMVNLTDTIEVGVSLSYRWTDGSDTGPYDDSELAGFGAGLFIRFAEF